MNLTILYNLLESSQEYKHLLETLDKSKTGVKVQLATEATPFVLSSLWQQLDTPMLIIAPGEEDARRLHEQLALWEGQDANIHYLPETDTLPFERLASDSYTTQQRIRTLSCLINSTHEAPLVVTSPSAVTRKTMNRQDFECSTHTLCKGQHINLEEILNLWHRMGYEFDVGVYGPGTVSRRGGILDIFPINSSMPARIELWGNEIDSIRYFDPSSQLSLSIIDSITVIPAKETLPRLSNKSHLEELTKSINLSQCNIRTQERISDELNLLMAGHEIEETEFYAGLFNQGSTLDYLPKNGILVMCRPIDIAQVAGTMEERANKMRQTKELRGELPRDFPSSHQPWNEIEKVAASTKKRLELSPWGTEEVASDDSLTLPFSNAPEYQGRLDRFGKGVEKLAKERHRVITVTSVPKRLGQILDKHGVKPIVLRTLEEMPALGSITVLETEGTGLSAGFVLSTGKRKLVILSDEEILGVSKQRRPQKRKSLNRERILSELVPGNYIVHVEHGIGKFLGTGRTDRDTADREYLIIEYAAKDKLYVPMDHLDRVTTYAAPMDQKPTLTRLGTQEWQRAKERAAQSTREMAGELLSLYATRELAEGNAFSPDTPWQTELEDSFPYQETLDQRKAIADVKSDMEQNRPMDRLICGDVGYGKTEIALRAAFKAVMDGKQVAILVPTTVLAQQHYVTFSHRLRAFPVNIEVLSRFRTTREQQDIVSNLASGKIDICVGTHRLIQKDVAFKNAGLVIVDEEQRFGVAHKERLKQIRKEVDVLTLTATPIPRTLHLSLAGIRDMSTIETPPEERLPIKTYVSESSDGLIREAIRRELDRQGQVFFLHNRVYNIDYMAGYVQTLVPEATIGIAHGQMPEGHLEQTMLDFASGKTNVLVCTTIIESGLDIHNANSLIVNRADTFGLAQLYQLRGRVGRGARRAYAYLLVPPTKSLTETSEKRLKTMLAATELGAGFQIAMKDLEIRGAGNILGSEQSGHIQAIGFTLYTRMLSKAVEELRDHRESGKLPDNLGQFCEKDTTQISDSLYFKKTESASIDLGIPAIIPGQYIPDLSTRLSIYRKFAEITSRTQFTAMQDELIDRFGQVPRQVQNILYVVHLKLLASEAGIQSVRRTDGLIVLKLQDETGDAKIPLQHILGCTVKVGNNQITIPLDKLIDGWEDLLMSVVEKLAKFRRQLGVDERT